MSSSHNAKGRDRSRPFAKRNAPSRFFPLIDRVRDQVLP
jgi:hypothetical protein